MYVLLLHKYVMVMRDCISHADQIQQLLLKKGAAAALMECLRGYVGEVGQDENCIQAGCQALRWILMHQ